MVVAQKNDGSPRHTVDLQKLNATINPLLIKFQWHQNTWGKLCEMHRMDIIAFSYPQLHGMLLHSLLSGADTDNLLHRWQPTLEWLNRNKILSHVRVTSTIVVKMASYSTQKSFICRRVSGVCQVPDNKKKWQKPSNSYPHLQTSLVSDSGSD